MYQDDSSTLHTNLYRINMMQVYFDQGIHNKSAAFEIFFRKEPFTNGYAVFAGSQRMVEYLENLHFTETDTTYLEDLGYPVDFITYLKDFKLELTTRSAKEGDSVFANEPIVQVKGPLAQCQLVETALLNIVNFQTLIVAKAARICSVTDDEPLLEFGSRRAQELDAAIWGTRAVVIGDANATSNVRAGKMSDIPVSGTHAHALVQACGDDYEAFMAYAGTHKDCVFLVDTYDTLHLGVPAAIRVINELGDRINSLGVHIDSGDMAYLSRKTRKQLDAVGYPNAKTYASNDLDENTILNLKMQKAKIGVWGVGTKLITAYDRPALSAVYRIISMEDGNGVMQDMIKLSNNAEKVSTPDKKQVWHITSHERNKTEDDYITFTDTDVNKLDEVYMFHPTYTYINKAVKDFEAAPLLVDIFDKGKLVYNLPSLSETQGYARKESGKLWNEYKRPLNPQDYPVDLSQEVWQNKTDLIDRIRKEA